MKTLLHFFKEFKDILLFQVSINLLTFAMFIAAFAIIVYVNDLVFWWLTN